MDGLPIMFITVPMLWPTAQMMGIGGIWFGIVLTQCLLIGQITPPLGIALYVASGVGGVSSEKVFRASYPFLLAMILALVIIISLPELSTLLPSLWHPK